VVHLTTQTPCMLVSTNTQHLRASINAADETPYNMKRIIYEYNKLLDPSASSSQMQQVQCDHLNAQ